ncbi:MAG: 2-amino-4-hydroxy-6-hydroxymethyldihydropteridine diphosphokinase [Sphingomonas sp. 28-62-20]|uniref:2-amino-4-hydroxy-6- hydroxymethyldihydropteridine diphosphokinase n=1 Tax=Sphingomonas sp. 28-62-20 TaxID=1970433 RepID=UPI000BCFFDC1|nr:MAG: 2-amino-4-hydroxy-6-hydroxymethyldihydropteridine diphosphokinase [Sphingomonas sp. 28-62-20]
MPMQSYAIALGSNRRGRHGSPREEVRAALRAIGGVIAASPIIDTPPIGPSIRRFANMVAIIESTLSPPELMRRLKAIERAYGRRRGRRWGARVIDLDIILWSGGCWVDRAVTLPHPQFRGRAFVLDPLAAIARDWRDPVTGLRVGQLRHRLRG